ncbi:MAG: putative DNA binding domain-containing protein [Candidatus Rokubacteria bacterium]|nr:putative DNA binding domain-containing protein [Candidatus Rokubacteria bacterium]MBI3455966.1 putative DNA binding domain-containing protein [Candidatus Rokubacteria bacterium]
MFDTSEAILNQLVAGEDSFAEFKEVRFGRHGVISPASDDMAGELVALANAEGGTIFLGVDDQGSVLGIPPERLRQVEEWVVNLATENCEPPIRPLFRRVMLPDARGEVRPVLLAQVRRGLYVHRTRGGRWLIRVGSTKSDLTGDELGRLLQERGRRFIFDETPVPTATREDLDQELLERHFSPPVGIDWTQLLVNARVTVADEDGVDRPTVAAVLCFSREPATYLPGAFIEAAVYRGERRHSDDLVHPEEIRGPVNNQIDEAVDFVDRFMLKPARKDVGREDYPQYSLGAVQEALVNAVAHRDYAVAGSRIRLFLYADRLEVISPGGLPNTVTLESMRYRQFTRNQLLVSFLSKMKSRRAGRSFLEERGEGVTRIIEESTTYSGREPTYELHGEQLHLTIWARSSPHQ